MPSVFDGSVHSQAFVALALIATVVSSTCSSLVIVLIRKMEIWNLHIALILATTVFQLLYDLSFFSGMVSTGSFELTITSNCCQLQGGVTSSIFSNLIAAVALYVVYYKRSIDILQYFPTVVIVAMLPGIAVNIMYITAVFDPDHEYLANEAVLGVYYFIRLSSICINFIFSIGTAYLISRMKSATGSSRTNSEVAIATMSRRLFYYPIVQAIGRSGCAWYEMTYGYEFSPDKGFNFNPDYTSNTQFAAQCMMVISTPLISVGYLAIFLVMQPDAARRCKELLRLDENWCRKSGTNVMELQNNPMSRSHSLSDHSQSLPRGASEASIMSTEDTNGKHFIFSFFYQYLFPHVIVTRAL